MTEHEAGSVKIMSSAQEVVRRGDLVAALSAANRERKTEERCVSYFLTVAVVVAAVSLDAGREGKEVAHGEERRRI
jgi:hypothetical protein